MKRNTIPKTLEFDRYLLGKMATLFIRKTSTSDSYRSRLCLPAHPKKVFFGSSSIVRGYDRSRLVLLDETGLHSSSSILTILPDTSNRSIQNVPLDINPSTIPGIPTSAAYVLMV